MRMESQSDGIGFTSYIWPADRRRQCHASGVLRRRVGLGQGFAPLAIKYRGSAANA